jgi:type IV pilus assembly protein PilM
MADILKDLQKGLGSLMASLSKKPDSVIGVDIGSSTIKVVQLSKKGGRVVLETYGAVPTGPYDDKNVGEVPTLTTDQIVTAVNDVLAESNITTKHAAFSLQSTASLIFVVELPGNIKESQFETVVPTEARKYIPIPLTEVSMDWWVIPDQEYVATDKQADKKQVLVVAVRNETLSEYRDIVKASGLNTNLFELEIFSIVRASFGHELEPVVVVDFGARSTRVAIIEYGIVRVYHTVNRGSYNITKTMATSLNIDFEKAEEMKKKEGLKSTDTNVLQVINTSHAYMFSEINSVLLQYEREYNKSIGRMLVTGGGSLMPGFLEKMKEEFPFEVQYVAPFEKTVYPEFLKDILNQSGPEFAVAIGLALKRLTL